MAVRISVLVAGTLPQTIACPDLPMHVSSKDRAVRLRRGRSRLDSPRIAEIGEETTTHLP
jgi:hypothetical protein